MAQYQEGQHLQGSDGKTYVVMGGVPRAVIATNPKIPLGITHDQLSNTGEQLSNEEKRRKAVVEAATQTATIRKLNAEGDKAITDANAAKVDLGIKQGTPPGDPSKYGDDYIATLPVGVQDLTTAMLGGKYKGNVTNSRNPTVIQAAIAAQHATHGQFDAGKYDERLALVKSMTDPNSSLGALNTALAHAGVLYDNAPNVAGTDALGHTPLSTAANAAWNSWHGSSPEVATYNDIVGKYGPEQAKAYQIGTGGERKGIEAQYDVNLPLDTKRALLKTDMGMYSGKISSLAHGYDMLGTNSPLDYLSPDAKAALQKIDPDTYKKLLGGGAAPGMGNGGPGAGTPNGGAMPPGGDVAAVNAQATAMYQAGKGPDEVRAFLLQHNQRPRDDKAFAAAFAGANRNNSIVHAPDAQPNDPPESNAQGYRGSMLGQGMSGVNEGFANALGGPVDLAAGAINLGTSGINALANTNLPKIHNSVMGGQWIKDNLMGGDRTIFAPTADPSQHFVRRVGQSVGGAIIPAGMAGSMAKAGLTLVGGVGGGLGAATAQQIAPGNVGAEMAGELLGGAGGAAGALNMAKRGATRAVEAAVPTIEDLKGQAGNLYRQAEARGVGASPAHTQGLSDNVTNMLADEGYVTPKGRINPDATKVAAAHQLISDYAGKAMSPTQMQAVRKVITNGFNGDSTEQHLAGNMLGIFDGTTAPLAPELSQARDVSSRYLQAQQLTQARELAGVQAGQFSGSGFENALRTQYRGLARADVKGQTNFLPDVSDAIRRVSDGTTGSNIARGFGKLAPTGVVSGGLGSLLPAIAAAGATGSAATGGMVGGGLAGLGIVGRAAATHMGMNAADQAELIARNGGALTTPQVLNPDLMRQFGLLGLSEAGKYQNPR